MKSSVKVELEASTSEDRVDMEAESTSTTTTAISTVGKPLQHGGHDGIIPIGRHQLPASENSRPKPPRK